MQTSYRVKHRYMINRLVLGLAAYVMLAVSTAQAGVIKLHKGYLKDPSFPDFVVLSNGIEPTGLEKPALPPAWSGRFKTPNTYDVPRIRSFVFGPVKMVVPANLEMGIGVAKEHRFDGSVMVRKDYKHLQKQINENISSSIPNAGIEAFAWHACKTHIDYLKAKNVSTSVIFSKNIKIPLHWYVEGEMKTTHINPISQAGSPIPFTSNIICKKFSGATVDHAGTVVTEQGEMGLYQMKTIPTRDPSNMYEKCPLQFDLASIVYSSQKGVLTTYLEYQDKFGKITKGPKRKINTGQANPNDGKVVTDFTDTVKLPIVKRAGPKPPAPGGGIGGLKTQQLETENVAPTSDKYVHQGAIRVVVKTGKPVLVSPNQQDDKGLKQAMASEWIQYLLTCKASVNPGFGSVPKGMMGDTNSTDTEPASPATGVVAPVIKTEPRGNTAFPQKKAKPKPVRNYVDVVIKDAKLSGRRLTIMTLNQGNADAQGCSLEVAYKTGKTSRQKSLTLGKIGAGNTISKSTRLAGIKTPTNIQIKARCANEPFARRTNNSKNL